MHLDLITVSEVGKMHRICTGGDECVNGQIFKRNSGADGDVEGRLFQWVAQSESVTSNWELVFVLESAPQKKARRR